MNIFETAFEEPEVDFPNSVIQNSIQDFEKATQSLVSLVIAEMDDMMRMSPPRLPTTFQYKILLTSQYIKGYSFEVMRFGYDVTIYPATFKIESDIAKELNIDLDPLHDCYTVTCDNEQEIVEMIKKVFNSVKFKKTVGGLMKIARTKA